MNQHDLEPDWFDPELAELEELSNGVLEHIEGGDLDTAERMCAELKQRFPDQIDGIERSAALYEARGQIDRAIECYRQCLVHIERHPADFDPDGRAHYRQEMDRLRERLGRD